MYKLQFTAYTGKQPNGYDAWRNLNRELFEVRPEAV